MISANLELWLDILMEAFLLVTVYIWHDNSFAIKSKALVILISSKVARLHLLFSLSVSSLTSNDIYGNS